MAMLDDINAYLVARSTRFGKLSGTTGNLGNGILLDSPSVPDTALALYNTQGFESPISFSTISGAAQIEFEKPGLQVLSRSTSYKTAQINADTVHDILDGIGGRVLSTASGTNYLSITAAQPPFFIGRDDNQRVLFSVNFNIWKEIDPDIGESAGSGAFDAAFSDAFNI